MIRPHNDISRFIEHAIEEVKSYFTTYEDVLFKKIDLPQAEIYLIYNIKIRLLKGKIAGFELKENGIIYKNGEDYFYFNFHGKYERKEEIVKRFVENYHLG